HHRVPSRASPPSAYEPTVKATLRVTLASIPRRLGPFWRQCLLEGVQSWNGRHQFLFQAARWTEIPVSNADRSTSCAAFFSDSTLGLMAAFAASPGLTANYIPRNPGRKA